MKVNTNPKYRYQVVYNNDEIILDTDNLNKAIKMARTCAKWKADDNEECTYSIYCDTDTQSMKIAEYIAE